MIANESATSGFRFSQVLSRVERLRRRLRTAVGKQQTSSLAAMLRLLSIQRRHGIPPVMALELGLTDPVITEAQISGCFHKSALLEIQDVLNPRQLIERTEDKRVFYRFCDDSGIPVPKTYTDIGRAAEVRSSAEWVERFVPTLPERFICKPALGVYGEGVTAWLQVDDKLVDQNGRTFTASEMFDLVCANPTYDRFVIQDRVENHAALLKVSGSTALQTVRIGTLIDAAGQAHITYAEWKIVVGSNVVDNFRLGQTGNLLASICLATGRVGPGMTVSPDLVGMVSVPVHPQTHQRIDGFQFPEWARLVEVARSAALKMLPLRALGWDIGMTPQGPVVIEANRWWDPPNEIVVGPAAPGVTRHEFIDAAALIRQEARRLGHQGPG